MERLKRILSVLMLLPFVLVVGCSSMVEVKIVTKAATPAVVFPTGTPVPPTPTLTPTVGVAATQTALVALAADVVATALAQASATVGASMPTPTNTPTATQTPVPPTAATTHTPRPPTPTLAPTAIPAPTGSIPLTIYLRDTNTETGYAALSDDRRYGWMIYKEGQTVYGDAAVLIGDTVYHFDEPGELGRLPDPWQVEFEFAEALVTRTDGETGFDAKKAWFWAGKLGDASAVSGDKPYSLTIKLYEGDELRERLQVFFTVAEQDGDVGVVVDTGGGGPPDEPPGGGPPGMSPGQDKNDEPP